MKKLIACALACLAIQASATAGTIEFSQDVENKITSITITDLSFTATSDFNDIVFQLRLADAYNSGEGNESGIIGAGFTLTINDTTDIDLAYTGNTITAIATSGEGSGDKKDFTFFLATEALSSISISSGDAISINGTVSVSPYNVSIDEMTTPDSVGPCNIRLVSGYDGAAFTDYASIELTTVPEPSTYAAFAGLGVLGLALLRRRKA